MKISPISGCSWHLSEMTQHSQQCWGIIILHFVCLVHRLHKSSDNLKAYIEYKIYFLSTLACKELYMLLWLVSIRKQSSAIDHRRNGNKTFLRISLLRFTSIYAGISKKKGPQFSRLYLRNCPEKMGENRFCAPCCLFLSFWAYRNLQGIPPCQLKCSEGGFQSPPLKAEHMSQEKTCWTCAVLALQLYRTGFTMGQNGKELYLWA